MVLCYNQQWHKGTKTVAGELMKLINGKFDVYFVMVKKDKPTNEVASIVSIQFEEAQ